ncbi:DUF6221 family protein [Streptomyces sp. NPDC093589]|uniref:DUF6221 family protein n=1 Tax=Streptomyces sp. NPDC093589 TaxID=3366043 RepID=UPI0038248332
MTAQGEDLLAFLESAISLREQRAHALGGQSITVTDHGWTTQLGGGIHLDGGVLHEDEVAHIVLNDPAAVLRRCAADRKLLELHAGSMHSCPAKDETGYLDEWTQFDYAESCPVVRLIAEGYGWTEGER